MDRFPAQLSGPRRMLAATGVAAMALLGAACTGAPAVAPVEKVAAGSKAIEFTSSPTLTTKPVFTIVGKGIDDRFADGLKLDLPALEKLPMVTKDINDPWEKRPITYRGVLMSDLLAAVGHDGATKMRLTALDDYVVTLSMKDLLSGDVLLATSADGKRLAVKDGGPTRIVFLPASATGRDSELWIWSIAEMALE
jgi:hypothetical protein